jgi:hypothetical protein
VSCGVEIMLEVPDDKYPNKPRPCKELKRAADEIKVDGTDER